MRSREIRIEFPSIMRGDPCPVVDSAKMMIICLYIAVGIPVSRGEKLPAQRPHASDPHADDRRRPLQHGPQLLQQARQIRHENGRVGRGEPGDFF